MQNQQETKYPNLNFKQIKNRWNTNDSLGLQEVEKITKLVEEFHKLKLHESIEELLKIFGTIDNEKSFNLFVSLLKDKKREKEEIFVLETNFKANFTKSLTKVSRECKITKFEKLGRYLFFGTKDELQREVYYFLGQILQHSFSTKFDHKLGHWETINHNFDKNYMTFKQNGDYFQMFCSYNNGILIKECEFKEGHTTNKFLTKEQNFESKKDIHIGIDIGKYVVYHKHEKLSLENINNLTSEKIAKNLSSKDLDGRFQANLDEFTQIDLETFGFELSETKLVKECLIIEKKEKENVHFHVSLENENLSMIKTSQGFESTIYIRGSEEKYQKRLSFREIGKEIELKKEDKDEIIKGLNRLKNVDSDLILSDSFYIDVVNFKFGNGEYEMFKMKKGNQKFFIQDIWFIEKKIYKVGDYQIEHRIVKQRGKKDYGHLSISTKKESPQNLLKFGNILLKKLNLNLSDFNKIEWILNEI